ncbi:MAG TPA: hypothetical protein VF659_08595 [Pyrinomonadaceae bacterium]|jgi:hypothetical protein
MKKARVMYVLEQYPAISETYIKNEMEAVGDDYEIAVISARRAQTTYRNHFPFRQLSDPAMVLEAVQEFRPHVLHGHWLHQAKLLSYLSKKTNIPFTLRAHSFDSIIPGRKSQEASDPDARGRIPSHIRRAAPLINDELCLGVITFPFTQPVFEAAGFRPEKIFPCYPVVNYQRFYDPSPNGDAVLNVGACIPKKKMGNYLKLAQRMPGLEFNLYPLSYQIDRISDLNQAMGGPVKIMPAIEPEDMPSEYKKHRWMVYTACTRMRTVGWPMAVAEAQASGVGVCIQNLRPDLKEYVGEAGYLFDTLREAADTISKPFPEEKRQLGFAQAKKSDIATHKTILTGLWQQASAAGL